MQRARTIFKEILRKDGCKIAEKTGSDNEEVLEEDEEEYVDDDFAGDDDQSYSQLNDSFDSTRDNDEEDELNLDDRINVVDETEVQEVGLSSPPAAKARKTATSTVVSDKSSAVKTKNFRPSGPSKQTGRRTVASATQWLKLCGNHIFSVSNKN